MKYLYVSVLNNIYKILPLHFRGTAAPFIRLLPILAVLLAPPPLLADGAIVKPPHDKRSYLFLTLPNQLRVLLISDPETDKAAASLDIRVGYFDDPAERPGLAHFLEHMLFLGTKKYPHPADYREFISAHGGSDNASTSDEHTNFYFEIEKDYLEQALDHFSQFFISPLFNETFVAREVQAVDSEYRLKIKDDGRRLWQVQKATANPAHPFTKFSVGNSLTLGSDDRQGLRRELITFYHEHYSANLMTLVVLGKEPLAVLQSVVEHYFSAIPNKRLTPPTVEVPLFLAQQKQTWINIEPVKDRRQLRLSFPFPWHQEYYLSKPTLLIAHLLGHEGPGSLYQLLRRKGWVNRLRVGNDVVASNEATLDVTLDLTENGLRFISTITGLVFQYIELIRRQGIQPWIYAELRQINELAFRSRETPPARYEVRRLAGSLHRFPPHLALRGPYEFKAYQADFLHDLLSRLVPENLRLTLIAKGLPTSEEETRYQVPYRITRLAPALLQHWAHLPPDPALAIPSRNPFLPEKAALKTVAAVAPVPALIHEESGLRVWHKQDDEFHLPKADVFVALSTALANDTAQHSILTRLYLMLVNDRLNALAYPASLAGLHYGISPGNGGILLTLGGYDEKQPQLLDLLLDQMLELHIDPQRFAIKKEQLRQLWKNSRHDRPYLQLNRELATILHHHSWTPETYLDALENLTPQQLADFITRLLAQLHIEVLSHGNLTPDEARILGRHIAARFFTRGRPAKAQPLHITLLPPAHDYLRRLSLEQEDAAVLVYYQGMAQDPASAARILLLHRVIKGPFFYLLRTRDQLGYVVYASPHTVLRRPGLKFLVQSPGLSVAQLRSRIETFLHEEFPPLLAAMSKEEFVQYRNGLINDILEKDNSLNERSHRYFKMLALKHYDFDYQQRLAEQVSRIGKEELQAFYRQWIADARGGRLIIEAYGKAHPEQEPVTEQEQLIEDVENFRRGMPAGGLPEM